MHSTTPERLEMCRAVDTKSALEWPDLKTGSLIDPWAAKWTAKAPYQDEQMLGMLNPNSSTDGSAAIGWVPPAGSSFGLGMYDSISLPPRSIQKRVGSWLRAPAPLWLVLSLAVLVLAASGASWL